MARAGYRPDIDGLRAVAIVPVVLFHCGVAGLPGGFTGVDIFFVISGYLITGILIRESIERGGIDLWGFYARRMARILPALLLVVTACLVAGALLLSSALFEVHALGKSAVASLGFVANLYFLAVSGDYFAPDAHGLVLLHTWSLAVEEQYYLVWPLLLMLTGRLGRASGRQRAAGLAAIGLVTVASLALCAWETRHDPTAAFYLPVTRAWELGAGSLVALVRRQPGAGAAAVCGLAGLGLMALGLATVREGALFPFPLALLPVAGAAMAIWAGSGAALGPAGRLLALRPCVAVGRVSYAWYLWHWPLLAFTHLLTVGQAGPGLKLAMGALSLGLAAVTVRWVENPVRFGLARRQGPRRVVLAGALASLVVAALAGAVYLAAKRGLLPGDARIAAAFNDRPEHQALCLVQHWEPRATLPAACDAAPGRRAILLWGDSHADQWAPALDAWARARGGWAVTQRTMAACPPLLGLEPSDPHGAAGQPLAGCRAFNAAVAGALAAPRRPTLAVLGGNWLPRAGQAPIGEQAQYFDVGAHDAAASLAALEEGLERSVGLLEAHGVPVVLVLQSPHPPLVAGSCVARLGAARCAGDAAVFEREAEGVNGVLRQVARRHPGVRLVDPLAILCPGGRCEAELDGRVAYYDAEHVAASVARSARAGRVWGPALDGAVR